MTYYLDTSALLRLVFDEEYSNAMRTWTVRVDPEFAATDLLRTEALRAARRKSPESVAEVRSRLDAVTFYRLSAAICQRAAELDPVILRTLDALHLAGALALGDDLQGLITYDVRLAEAARLHGVSVVTPV